MTNLHLGQLTRCPFCGGGKLALRTLAATDTEDAVIMRCTECGGMGPPVPTPKGRLVSDDKVRLAVQAWNKRAL